MRPSAKWMTAVIWVLAVVTGGSTAWAGVVRTVGQPGAPCRDAQYTTITAAVNAASPGDEVEVCPGLYDEQVTITKPLELRGAPERGVGRVLIQPSAFTTVPSLGFEAVITVLNTHDVTIRNVAVDASKNSVMSCTPSLAVIHFHDASGTVVDSAIFGAKLASPLGCARGLPFGNGFGVQVDSDSPATHVVTLKGNSIHDFTANGILAQQQGVIATITANSIAGVGPSGGVFQFGIFIANGAVGRISDNTITEGSCGTIAISDCIPLRSEGITLRNIGSGTVIEHNVINKAQSGIFINGASKLTVKDNVITNIDALSGMDIQGTASGSFTGSRIENNLIANVGPIDANASADEEGCGINEYSGTGVSANVIEGNTINDAYCGVAHVTADDSNSNRFFNALYTELNSDSFPTTFPPPVEP